MDNFNELKVIWQTAKTEQVPTPEAIIKIVHTFKATHIRNKWLTIIGSVLLILVVLSAIYVYESAWLTTRIGALLLTLSCFLLARAEFRSLSRFEELEDCTNIEFLIFIEKTYQNQIYHYNRTQLYSLLLAVFGLTVYLYELSTQKLLPTLVLYILCLGGLAFIWFVVRPRSLNNSLEKLKQTKNHFEKLIQQIKTYENE
jgi:uncharacterized membrane protein HdeD (DUF308 family)